MSARRVGRLLRSKFQAFFFFSFSVKISPKIEIEKSNTVIPATLASSKVIILFSEMLKFSKHFFFPEEKIKSDAILGNYVICPNGIPKINKLFYKHASKWPRYFGIWKSTDFLEFLIGSFFFSFFF